MIQSWRSFLETHANHPLPVYPGREAYYSISRQLRCAAVGSDNDREDFSGFLRNYRNLFREDAALQQDAEEMTILLPNRVFTGNEDDVEAQLNAIRHTIRPTALRLDAAKLKYISSVGLRMVLRLLNEYASITMINVSEAVYETLDISGFTSMMRVDRMLKQVSIDGCELIGKGLNGSVYRYSPDTVVKVYSEKNQLDDVRRENQMSRFCFVSGLPTAIPLNLVMVGKCYGAMYELLDAHSLTSEILTHPEQRENLVDAYIALIKRIHGIAPQAKDLPKGLTLPNHKEIFLGWASELEAYFDRETLDRLRQAIGGIPKKNTLLHGDLHPSNIMNAGGEMILIDLDGVGLGDPIFDLANIAAVLAGFPGLLHNDVLGWGDPGLRAWILKKTLEGYYSGLNEAELEAKKHLVMLCMYTRIAHYALRHDTVNETDRNEALKKLYELVQAYH